MKINELYSAVAKLGFEDSLEDISAFFYAANRAMLQINALRPLTAILEIYHRASKNLVVGATHDILEHTNEDLIFECSGGAKAYYFEANGTGECRVEVYNSDTSEWEECDGEIIRFSTKVYATHRGFVKLDGEFVNAPVRLRFIGDYAYGVRNVALWGILYSPEPKDIPAFTEYVKYDLRELDPDFIELADNPFISSFTRITDDYIFEAPTVLLLPREIAIEVKIKYKKRPRMLIYTDDPADDDTEIELDAELAELLPLLTAVYVFTDGEEEKSQYYLTLYRERAAEIEMRKRSREPAVYENATGW